MPVRPWVPLRRTAGSPRNLNGSAGRARSESSAKQDLIANGILGDLSSEGAQLLAGTGAETCAEIAGNHPDCRLTALMRARVLPWACALAALSPAGALMPPLHVPLAPRTALRVARRGAPPPVGSYDWNRSPPEKQLPNEALELCVYELTDALSRVRELRPTQGRQVVLQRSLWRAQGRNPKFKVSGLYSGEPSFTRLFTHETWSGYTGLSPWRRWLRVAQTWRFSTILASVAPICLAFSTWAFCIARLPAALLPRTSPVPMSLMGTAIGLLLVFRTNNSYLRLNEARALWGGAVYLSRELAQGVATALLFDPQLPDADRARQGASRIYRHIAAYAWELQAKLSGRPGGEEVAPDNEIVAWHRPPSLTRELAPGEQLDVLQVPRGTRFAPLRHAPLTRSPTCVLTRPRRCCPTRPTGSARSARARCSCSAGCAASSTRSTAQGICRRMSTATSKRTCADESHPITNGHAALLRSKSAWLGA